VCSVIALQHISPDEVIFADPCDHTQAPSIQIVGQFDGSHQREELIGGAGYVIYAVEGGQSRVLACRAVALPQCSDNIEAEILACLYLVEEVSTLVKQLLIERDISPR
jgi:ribonuclease HI